MCSVLQFTICLKGIEINRACNTEDFFFAVIDVSANRYNFRFFILWGFGLLFQFFTLVSSLLLVQPGHQERGLEDSSAYSEILSTRVIVILFPGAHSHFSYLLRL